MDYVLNALQKIGVVEGYKRKSKKELQGIAKDYLEGAIFTDRHLGKNLDKILLVFSKIKNQPKMIKEMRENRAFFIYEYMSESSGPDSEDSLPRFKDYKTLDKIDTEKMLKFYEELKVTRTMLKFPLAGG